MTEDIRSELKTKMSELASFLIKNNIYKETILDEAMNDPHFDVNREIVGQVLNYFEWRVHPLHPQIECSTEGDIRINGSVLYPKIYRGYKTIKYVRGKKTMDIDVASTVLSTYRPKPTDGEYIVGFRDENPMNTRINNLYWRRTIK